ncbi:MAG: hypothetical protein R2941_00100 [Desulfobacterales bacterium]
MKLSPRTLSDMAHRKLMYYLLYAGILMGFAMLILYPNFRKIRQTESDIEVLEKKINDQNMLYDQYAMYMAEIEKLDKINYFNFTVSIGSEKCILSELRDDIENICKEHGFSFDRKDSGITPAPDRILLTCSITGRFCNLRDVLIDFGKMSCLEGIDQIQISPSGKSSEQKIVLTLCLYRPTT